jgi:hypothetical protein
LHELLEDKSALLVKLEEALRVLNEAETQDQLIKAETLSVVVQLEP